jgi:hypothetical protein
VQETGIVQCCHGITVFEFSLCLHNYQPFHLDASLPELITGEPRIRVRGLIFPPSLELIRIPTLVFALTPPPGRQSNTLQTRVLPLRRSVVVLRHRPVRRTQAVLVLCAPARAELPQKGFAIIIPGMVKLAYYPIRVGVSPGFPAKRYQSSAAKNRVKHIPIPAPVEPEAQTKVPVMALNQLTGIAIEQDPSDVVEEDTALHVDCVKRARIVVRESTRTLFHLQRPPRPCSRRYHQNRQTTGPATPPPRRSPGSREQPSCGDPCRG